MYSAGMSQCGSGLGRSNADAADEGAGPVGDTALAPRLSLTLSWAPRGGAPVAAVVRGPRAQVGLALRARRAPHTPRGSPGRSPRPTWRLGPVQGSARHPVRPAAELLSPGRVSEPRPGRPANTRCDVRPVTCGRGLPGWPRPWLPRPCGGRVPPGRPGRGRPCGCHASAVSRDPFLPAVSGSKRERDSRPGQDGRPCRPEAPCPLGSSSQLCGGRGREACPSPAWAVRGTGSNGGMRCPVRTVLSSDTRSLWVCLIEEPGTKAARRRALSSGEGLTTRRHSALRVPEGEGAPSPSSPGRDCADPNLP